MKPRIVCEIDYTSRALDAEKRLRNGEKQAQCPNCKRWFWVSEREHHACAEASG